MGCAKCGGWNDSGQLTTTMCIACTKTENDENKAICKNLAEYPLRHLSMFIVRYEDLTAAIKEVGTKLIAAHPQARVDYLKWLELRNKIEK